jgi:hypothetical protein
MGKELEEANVRELAEEIRRFGLPESVITDMQKQVSENKNNDLMLFFETTVEGQVVKGSLSVKWEPTYDSLKPEYLTVHLGDNPAAMHKSHRFIPYSEAVTLREAVNLMEGRPVYRVNPKDSAKGYWLFLASSAGDNSAKLLDFVSKFKPEKAIGESPLGKWLDSAAQIVLGEQLRWGERVRVEIGAPGQEKPFYIEADVRGGRLRVTDGRRMRVDLPDVEKDMGLKASGVRHGRGR